VTYPQDGSPPVAPNPNTVRWLERLLLIGAFGLGGWWLQNSYLGYLALREDLATLQTTVAGEYVRRAELAAYFADIRVRQDRLEDLLLRILRDDVSMQEQGSAPYSLPDHCIIGEEIEALLHGWPQQFGQTGGPNDAAAIGSGR